MEQWQTDILNQPAGNIAKIIVVCTSCHFRSFLGIQPEHPYLVKHRNFGCARLGRQEPGRR